MHAATFKWMQIFEKKIYKENLMLKHNETFFSWMLLKLYCIIEITQPTNFNFWIKITPLHEFRSENYFFRENSRKSFKSEKEFLFFEALHGKYNPTKKLCIFLSAIKLDKYNLSE